MAQHHEQGEDCPLTQEVKEAVGWRHEAQGANCRVSAVRGLQNGGASSCELPPVGHEIQGDSPLGPGGLVRSVFPRNLKDTSDFQIPRQEPAFLPLALRGFSGWLRPHHCVDDGIGVRIIRIPVQQG